jgi:hypothetical protein
MSLSPKSTSFTMRAINRIQKTHYNKSQATEVLALILIQPLIKGASDAKVAPEILYSELKQPKRLSIANIRVEE